MDKKAVVEEAEAVINWDDEVAVLERYKNHAGFLYVSSSPASNSIRPE